MNRSNSSSSAVCSADMSDLAVIRPLHHFAVPDIVVRCRRIEIGFKALKETTIEKARSLLSQNFGEHLAVGVPSGGNRFLESILNLRNLPW